MNSIDRVIEDQAKSPAERQLEVNRLLAEEGERGIETALHAVGEPVSEIHASYAANYLGSLPALARQKNDAMRALLERKPEWVVAIANLIEFADDDTVERLTAPVLAQPGAPGAMSVAYELAQHFPDRMRPDATALRPFDVHEFLLPGAPDDWVADLLKKYRADANGQWAIWISYIRTDAARDALVTLFNAAPSGRQNFFAALLDSAGVFADTREPSTYQPSFRGFVAAPGKSPHVVGGEVAGNVPISPIDKQPADRIVEWRRRELPFEVGGTSDPIYFWHDDHHAPGHVYVRRTDKGLEGLMTPMGPAGKHNALVAAAGSIVLEKERHPYGIGGAAIKGSGRIQVGGYPQWRTLERFPRCGNCGYGMRFLSSIDSGLASFTRFTFAGVLYAFWCERCDVSCTYRQL